MRVAVLFTFVLAVGLAAAVASARQAQPGDDARPLYFCPMHPEITATTADKCGRCGMTLIAGDPLNADEYRVELTITPRAPRPGQPARLRFTVRHPVSNAIVNKFALVHEKPYHLFILRHDLEFYDHVHPEQENDGSYVIDFTLPSAGFYKLYSDFLPVGGAPQVVPSLVATADFTGDLFSSRAKLLPDVTLQKTVANMHVSLTLPSSGLVAGRDETLRYSIRDARTGADIRDIEPYLGAFGHTLVMSEDTLHYVHAHPVELLPDGADGKPVLGGPDLTFKALLPKPGRYRIWTQLKRGGTVSTVHFTVDAASPTSGL